MAENSIFRNILDNAIDLGFDYGREALLSEDQAYKQEQIALSTINGSGPLLDGREAAMNAPTGDVEFAFGANRQQTAAAQDALSGAGYMAIAVIGIIAFLLFKKGR